MRYFNKIINVQVFVMDKIKVCWRPTVCYSDQRYCSWRSKWTTLGLPFFWSQVYHKCYSDVCVCWQTCVCVCGPSGMIFLFQTYDPVTYPFVRIYTIIVRRYKTELVFRIIIMTRLYFRPRRVSSLKVSLSHSHSLSLGQRLWLSFSPERHTLISVTVPPFSC